MVPQKKVHEVNPQATSEEFEKLIVPFHASLSFNSDPQTFRSSFPIQIFKIASPKAVKHIG